MDVKILLIICAIFLLVVENIGGPIQFPVESTKAIGDGRTFHGDGGKFHHKKKKKRKKKKHGCLLHHHLHHRSAHPLEGPEARTFFLGVNYYDTDIHIINSDYKPTRPLGGHGGPGEGSGNECGHGIETLGGLSGLGGLVGLGGGASGGSGSSSSSSSSSSGSSGSGDNDEDYDYSEGAPSSNNGNSGSNSIGQGISNLSSFVGPATGVVSSVISTVGSGIRPIFERPERYFDYYIIRPINRSLRTLVSWF